MGQIFSFIVAPNGKQKLCFLAFYNILEFFQIFCGKNISHRDNHKQDRCWGVSRYPIFKHVPLSIIDKWWLEVERPLLTLLESYTPLKGLSTLLEGYTLLKSQDSTQKSSYINFRVSILSTIDQRDGKTITEAIKSIMVGTFVDWLSPFNTGYIANSRPTASITTIHCLFPIFNRSSAGTQ